MFEKLKRRMRIRRIKKEALLPRPQTVTVEDIRRKLRDYTPPTAGILRQP